ESYVRPLERKSIIRLQYHGTEEINTQRYAGTQRRYALVNIYSPPVRSLNSFYKFGRTPERYLRTTVPGQAGIKKEIQIRKQHTGPDNGQFFRPRKRQPQF